MSYKTFDGYIESLAGGGVPEVVRREDLAGRGSATVLTQLMAALRFTGLTDEGDRPTAALRGLADAVGTPAWPARLADVVRSAFAPVFAVGLDGATAEEFEAAFREYPGSSDAVRRKCMLFFLAAAQAAEIPVSEGIRDIARRSGDGGLRSRAASERPAGGSDTPHSGADALHTSPSPQAPAAAAPPANPYRAAYDALSAVWEPDAMPEDVDTAVVTLLRHLRKREREEAKA